MKTWFVIVATLCAFAAADTECTGTLGGNTITNDVVVPEGASCTLATSVTGSVSIGKGSSFTSTGDITVNGQITARDAGSVVLGGALKAIGGVEVFGATGFTVSANANGGGVSVLNTPTVNIQGAVSILDVLDAATVTIGANASPASVFVDQVANTNFKGNTSSLQVSGNGTLVVDGGSITGGGLLRTSGTGDVTVCGGTVQGGIEFSSVTGKLTIVASATCPAASISGTINVAGGAGDIKIADAKMVGADVLVSGRSGNVELINLALSDVGITNLVGSLTMNSMADSDTTIDGVSGAISVSGFKTEGDFAILNPGSSVTVKDSDFGLEDVSVKGAGGVVSITNNKNIGLTLEENTQVTVTGNTGTDVNLSKNGQVTFNGNTFDSVVCSDNTAVTGSGNTIGFGDGAGCSSGLA